jgi:endonuclease YncB( thermonuclease family)
VESWRQAATVGLGLAVVLGLSGMPARAETVSQGATACSLPTTRTVVAVEAIDGDTIRVDGGVVRLAGIEAPKANGFGDSAQADAARARLDALVAGRILLLAEVGDGPDRYGRLHAQVFLDDGQWLQAALVESGLARIRSLAGEESCIPALFASEDAARRAENGVWAGDAYDPLSADDPSLSQRNGLYELVEGRVLSVGHGSVMIFLDFGRNYRRDFTAMIPKPMAALFAEAGLPVEALKGRRVRVRGVIEESGGPAVRLNHPTAIEVLGDE